MKHGVDTVEVVSGPTPVLDVSSAIVGAFGTATTAAPGSIVKTLSYDEAKEKLGAGSLLDALRRVYQYSERATVISYVTMATLSGASAKSSSKAKSESHEGVAVLNASNKEENAKLQDEVRLERMKAADPELAAFIDTLPLIRKTQAILGFMPKIFIAPGLIDKEGAASQAVAAIRKTRGMWITEPPADSTKEQAKAYANGISDYRAACYYPRLKVLQEDGSSALDWAAPSYAGLMVQMDKNMTGEPIETGYWCSPSNLKLVDAVASEFDYEYLPNDSDCDVIELNAAGIVTTINFNGLRAFGNRNTAYPSKSDVMTFTAWRRTMDVIEEAIEKFAMQYLDRPMFTSPDDLANTLIGRVAESVNDYLRGKIGESLVYGECFIKQEHNPLSNLMQGKVKFHYKATPAMVMEAIEFEAEIYSKGLEDALSQLLGSNS
ncbi:TPA: phage tail sheath family protein [Vibrio harveyi]